MFFVQNSKNSVTESRNPKDKSIMSLLIENIFIKTKKTATAIAKLLQMWYNNYISDERSGTMDIQVGDILRMKKEHPCGSKEMLVLRIGADFKLKCTGCGREFMTPRSKCEKKIKSVIRNAVEEEK